MFSIVSSRLIVVLPCVISFAVRTFLLHLEAGRLHRHLHGLRAPRQTRLVHLLALEVLGLLLLRLAIVIKLLSPAVSSAAVALLADGNTPPLNSAVANTRDAASATTQAIARALPCDKLHRWLGLLPRPRFATTGHGLLANCFGREKRSAGGDSNSDGRLSASTGSLCVATGIRFCRSPCAMRKKIENLQSL
jgi:hypothetical protein